MRAALSLFLVAAMAHGQEPLPVSRSATLSAGTYVLNGSKHLPKGVKLVCKPGVRIVGEGNGGLLVIEGTFETQGTKDAKVAFENVWLQPYHNFQRIRIGYARFGGKGGLYTSQEREARGKLELDHVEFKDKACIWVELYFGHVSIKRVSSEDSCRITATRALNNLSVEISDCFADKGTSGFAGGLSIYNVKDVKVLRTRFGGRGATTRFENCTKILLEGCRFDGRALLVKHRKKGGFKKTKVRKCDFHSKYLIFEAPERSKDRVTLDGCYFADAAGMAPNDLARKLTEGSRRVSIAVKAPSETPNSLAGKDKP